MRLLLALFCLFSFHNKIYCPPAEPVGPVERGNIETEPERQDIGQKAPPEQVPPTGTAPAGEPAGPVGEPISTIPISTTPGQTTVTLQPSTTQAPSQETGTISIKSTPTQETAAETIPTKEQTIADWSKQWSSLEGGWFTKGELAKTSPEQRAQKILDFIQAIPTGFFDDPEKAISSLATVLSTAKTTLKGAPEEQAEYAQIFDAIINRAFAVIQKGDFGSDPLKALEELSTGSFRNTLAGSFDASPELTSKFDNARYSKMVQIVADTPLGEGVKGIQQLDEVITELKNNLTSASPALQQQADAIISQKLATALKSLQLPANTGSAIKELTQSYAALESRPYLSAADKAQLQQDFNARLEALSKTGDFSDVTSTFIALFKEDKFKTSQDRKVALSILSSLVSEHINKSGTVLTNLDQGSILSDYKNEADNLAAYLKLTRDGKFASFFSNPQLNPDIYKGALSAAERLLEINDFIRQRQDLLDPQQKSLAAGVLDFLGGIFKGSDDIFNVSKKDPKFWSDYQAQKKYNVFKNPDFIALPSDMLTLGMSQLPDLQKSVQAGQISADQAGQMEQLYKIRTALSDKFIQAQLPQAADFVKQFDDMVNILKAKDAQVVTDAKNSVQDSIKRAQDGTAQDVASLGNDLDAALKKLEALDNQPRPNFLDQAYLQKTYDQLQAWKSASDFAYQYSSIDLGQARAGQINVLLNTLQNSVLTIRQNFDYRKETVFLSRLQTMNDQRVVLEAVNKVLTQPISAAGKQYTLGSFADAFDKAQRYLEVPDEQTRNALKELGFIDVIESNGTAQVLLTDRGVQFSKLAAEAKALELRIGQLQDYTQKNGSALAAPKWQPLSDTPAAQNAAQLAVKLNLSGMILADQMEVLQDLFAQAKTDPRRYEIYQLLQRLGTIEAPPEGILFNRELLEDVREILTTLDTQNNNGLPINRDLEILIEDSVRQAAQAGKEIGILSSEMEILLLNATGDIQVSADITPITLAQQISNTTGQVGLLAVDAMRYSSLQMLKTFMGALKIASLIGKVGSIFAGIWAYFTVKQAVSPFPSSLLPGLDIVENTLGLVAGSGTGIALWLISSQVEPSRETLEALNTRLKEQGIKPIDISQDSSMVAKAKDWANSFLQTDFQQAVASAKSQQKVVESSISNYNTQRKNLYSLLGLDSAASSDMLKQALANKLDALEKPVGFIGRLGQSIEKRRLSSQMRLFTQAAQDMARAHQNEMTQWVTVALKAVTKSALENKSVLAENFGKVFKGIGSLWTGSADTTSGQATPPTFDAVFEALQGLSNQQQANISALLDALRTAQGQIPPSPVVKPDRVLELMSLVLKGQMETVRNEFNLGIAAVLKDKGYNVGPVDLPKSTQSS